MKKYEYIDSLRGLAILGVIFVHTSQSISDLHPFVKNICNYGKHGVQLFFFVSAYTLCLSKEGRENEDKANIKYFIRRFFRIAPLYYFGILLYGVIYYMRGHDIIPSFNVNVENSWTSIFRHLTFTQSLSPGPIFQAVPGGWSIGTEMMFYLIFPFLFSKISSLSKKWIIISLPIAAAISAFVFFRALPHLFPPVSKHDFNFYYCTLLNQLPVFLMGICFYTIFKNKVYDTKQGLLFFMAFMFLSLIMLTVKYFDLSDISLFPFFTSVTFAFLFFAFKSIEQLNFKFLQLIGRVSFSIYLFHFIFAWGISTYINQALVGKLSSVFVLTLCLAVTTLGTLLMAIVTKQFIEDKGIAMGSKLIKKLSKIKE